MEAFLVSTGAVFIGEMGDKTQLLAMLLAARFRRPWPIVWGILAATTLNHAAAGFVGGMVATALGPQWLRWIVGGSFIAMAAWMLKPDAADELPESKGHAGVFWTTTVAFFFAEMGDKTQLATVALAARYDALVAVVAGTTLGMMAANVPVVLFGERVTRRLSMRLVHGVSAGLFAVLGVLTLLNVGQVF